MCIESCKRFGGAALENPGEADDGCGDEKKLRADNPTIFNYACILKSCKRERTGEGFMGVKGLGTTDQEKMGIGVVLRKRSRGWKWLMGELGERKVNSSAWVSWDQIIQRSRGRGCVVEKLENGNGRSSEKTTGEDRGEGEWVTWEQEKGTQK
jgi:hypothetical protein